MNSDITIPVSSRSSGVADVEISPLSRAPNRRGGLVGTCVSARLPPEKGMAVNDSILSSINKQPTVQLPVASGAPSPPTVPPPVRRTAPMLPNVEVWHPQQSPARKLFARTQCSTGPRTEAGKQRAKLAEFVWRAEGR